MDRCSASATRAGGRWVLRPYQFIMTPALTLVLDAIAAQVPVGATFVPGVRALARWAGLKSAGHISPILYQLAADGWIAYDGAGAITLLVHPDNGGDTGGGQPCVADDPPADRGHDHGADRGSDPGAERGDHGADRGDDPRLDRGDHARDRGDYTGDRHGVSPARISDAHRVPMGSARRRGREPGRDQRTICLVQDLHEQQQSHAAVVHEDLPSARVREAGVDQGNPAVRALTALGAGAAIIADALHARPDLTWHQVQATWEWHAQRRARSGGRLGEGVFFHAIRQGQIAMPPEPDGIDVRKYTSGAYGDLFRGGGDMRGLEHWGDPRFRDAVPCLPSQEAH